MKRLFELNHINFNPNHFPYMSVKDRILPPEIDFKILPVALPISGPLVLAATAKPILRAGFRKLFQAFSKPLIIFSVYSELIHPRECST